MLQQKLAEAQSSQSKKRRTFWSFAALAVIAALLSIAFVYFFTQFDFPRIKRQEAQESGSPGEIRAAQPEQNADPGAAEENQALREQFMQQLARYESEVEAQIAAIRLHIWNEEQHAKLVRLKERAVEYFAAGEYLLGSENLRQAEETAAAAAQQYASQQDLARRTAHEAFANNRIAAAEKAIEQALRINPNDAEMQALRQRVGVLPQVLNLLRQADAAQKENRPAKEAAALRQALSLDAARTALETRLKKVQARLHQQQFSDAIRATQRALEAGRLADAAQYLSQAKSIFSTHEAIQPLQARIQQARQEKEFARTISLGEQAKQRDDWPAAERYFRRARQLKADEKIAVENHNAAQEVIDATRTISRYLADEHRLSDAKIAALAAAYLRESESFTALSPKLRNIHGDLKRRVLLHTSEVDVIVVSDNKTHITVRGEGQVGKTLRHTIRLRPGRYIFEGSRTGYKSKLVNLEIKVGASFVEVAVACDEKL